MLTDIRDLAPGTVIGADVCIVGAGPAGLALATKLIGSGLRIALLEAGGEPRLRKRLGEARVPLVEESCFDPPPLTPPSFGGAANEWIVRLPWMRSGVRVVPLSPIDLETRSWIPNSGWPIGWDELRRYYLRANTLLGLNGWGYDLDDWDDDGRPVLPLSSEGFTTAIERFARADVFTRDLLRVARAADDLTVYLNAQVGHLQRRGDQVDQVEIDTDHDRPITVAGKVVVLACGGLRNAQILFNADDGSGLGNGHDALGRYYMDHLRVASGTITPSSSNWGRDLGSYDMIRGVHGLRSAKIAATDELLERDELLHSAARIMPVINPNIRSALRRGRDEVNSVSKSSAPELVKASVLAAMAGAELSVRQRRFPPRVDAGWSELSIAAHVWSMLAVEHQIEQAPDPGNRVIPSTQVDRFGRRQVQLHWNWTEADLSSLATTIDRFGRAVANAGLGRFQPNRWDDAPPLTTPDGAFHPMGATRMSASPRSGVVDANLRVHGTSNLFVVGSSVFPTGGYANPVLTLIALAIRLADRLKTELTTRVSTP